MQLIQKPAQVQECEKFVANLYPSPDQSNLDLNYCNNKNLMVCELKCFFFTL